MIVLGSKKISRSTGGNIAIFLFLILLGLVMILPFVYAILQAIKPIDEIYIFPPRFWVQRPTLKNFSSLFKLATGLWVPFSRYIFNSLFVTTVCTAAQVVLASMAAYPLAKNKFRGQKIIFNMVIISLLFTGEVTFLPQYILISSFRLIDNYLALILPSLAFPLGLYLMRQNMLHFPDSVIESARIDGAPERTVFWSIVMPSVKPVWMTMILFSFVSMWNRSDSSYIYSEQSKSLPTLLSQISAGGIARAGAGAAAVVILMLPPIVVFLISQSKVIETMANSGMKE